VFQVEVYRAQKALFLSALLIVSKGNRALL